MDDSPTYPQIREILGSCGPWFVRNFYRDARALEVSLAHDADAQFCCALCDPMCDPPLPFHGDGPMYVYRCVTCEGVRVYVRFRLPQVICPIHGAVHADVLWMHDPARWHFERIEYDEDDPIYRTIH